MKNTLLLSNRYMSFNVPIFPNSMEDVTEGSGVNVSNAGDTVILFLTNSSEEIRTVTVKGGNGVFGGKDLTLEVLPGNMMVRLDTGRYMDVTGENAGQISFSATGTDVQGFLLSCD